METDDQDAAAAWKEGGQDGACGREPLLDWMSWSWSWSRGSRCGAITSVRRPLPHSPGWRGTRSNPLRWRSSLRDSERSRKNRSIQGISPSFFIYVFVRSSFSPLGFFLSFALPGIWVHYCPGLAVGNVS